jgi:hypothetical protein
MTGEIMTSKGFRPFDQCDGTEGYRVKEGRTRSTEWPSLEYLKFVAGAD